MAWITVEVDLDEFDDDEIQAEHEARGLIASSVAAEDKVQSLALELYYSFVFNREDKSIDLAKRLAEEITGRIL